MIETHQLWLHTGPHRREGAALCGGLHDRTRMATGHASVAEGSSPSCRISPLPHGTDAAMPTDGRGVARPDYEREGVRLYRGDCLEILPQLEAGSVDAVVTDPPYSHRTHRGHDMSASGRRGEGFDGSDRSELGYAAWTDGDVNRVVPQLCRIASGWCVVMTDHMLARPIQQAMEAAGRYAFAPLPYYAPGSRVRLSGDGPSSWTIWIVVSRTSAQHRWGTLPGGYVAGPGWRERTHMGGKPTRLMQAIAQDYSREGDTILDPFMGSGTTGVACIKTGRKFIGIEREPRYFDIAVKRIEQAFADQALFVGATA